MSTYKKGDDVFLEDGEFCQYQGEFDGQHIVKAFIENSTRDGDYLGGSFLVDRVFPEEPIHRKSLTMVHLEIRIEAYEKALERIQRAFSDAEHALNGIKELNKKLNAEQMEEVEKLGGGDDA